jgi:tetratricopeptide (TPR) repeat protein
VSGWEVSSLDAIGSLPGPGTLRWTPVRRHFGIGAFGVNAYTAQAAGQDVVEEHTEETLGHEELYVVLTGHATFTLDGEEVDAPAGTAVFLRDPKVKRAAVAREPGTTVLAIGGKPGEPYEPSAWEWYFAADPLIREARFDEAIAELEDGLAEKGENAAILYTLACAEALGGRREDAIAHARRAIELRPEFGPHAQTDEDLASIRDEL